MKTTAFLIAVALVPAILIGGLTAGWYEAKDSEVILRTVTTEVTAGSGDPDVEEPCAGYEGIASTPVLQPGLETASLPQGDRRGCDADYSAGYQAGSAENRYDFNMGFESGYDRGYEEGYQQGRADYAPI